MLSVQLCSWTVALPVFLLSGCGDGSAKTNKEPAYQQTGEASWYGPGFHGKKTANGEVYDQNELTAAHRTLPLGTDVEVTNVKNGRSVAVEINDRGPYVRGRVIDLSRAAAIELGIKEKGLATVKIEAESPKEKAAPVHNGRKLARAEKYAATRREAQ
ncbi:MAG: septal ring lytic transglycosylase RlpA family protein [Gammaproteobacteria bacterium]